MFKLGLIGKMGAGKSYTAESLVKTHGGERIAFADALKQDVIKYGLTIDGTIQKNRDRKILQDYGQFRRGELLKIETPTSNLVNFSGSCYLEKKDSLSSEITRNYIFIGPAYKDYWVQQLVDAIFLNSSKSIVVDDIRRVNEAVALAENGFVIIKIQCPDEVRFQRLKERDSSFDPETLNNISETETDLIPYDFEINNDNECNPLEIIEKLKCIK